MYILECIIHSFKNTFWGTIFLKHWLPSSQLIGIQSGFKIRISLKIIMNMISKKINHRSQHPIGQRISALHCIKNYAIGCKRVSLLFHLYYEHYAQFIFKLLYKKETQIKYSNTQAVSCDLITFQFVKYAPTLDEAFCLNPNLKLCFVFLTNETVYMCNTLKKQSLYYAITIWGGCNFYICRVNIQPTVTSFSIPM